MQQHGLSKELKIISSGDGSQTLYLPDQDETYHSVHGALTESMHVFIEAGMRPLKSLSELRIFEFGFGTGLNAWLSAMEAEKQNQVVHYTTIEKYPLDIAITSQLSYTSNPFQQETFNALHAAEWNIEEKIHDYFTVQKLNGGMENLIPSQHPFHLIYFDAFAPRVQPELWTIAMFSQLFSLLEKDGILVTYCAKGEVKRNMKAAGFVVEPLPGPPGKREMTRAWKK
jgi:tRNA U34 5-methylaminomethyl-2-thiouridine-forming methyltransferase MnmC